MQNIEMDSLANFQDYNIILSTGWRTTIKGQGCYSHCRPHTGIDTDRIISTKLSLDQPTGNGQRKSPGDEDKNCYMDDTFGWNFVDNNNNVRDLHKNLHGTLVSHYIINNLQRPGNNAVQIMTLKTHDKNGTRRSLLQHLCDSLCHGKGANIINASWGFYLIIME